MSQIDKELANKILKGLGEAQKISELSPETREKLNKAAGAVAGDQLSDWLPDGWGRKIIMAVLFMIGLYGAIEGPFNLIWFWLAILLFSPRCVGWAAYMAGVFTRGLNNK